MIERILQACTGALEFIGTYLVTLIFGLVRRESETSRSRDDLVF